jgi:hypothetical protein
MTDDRAYPPFEADERATLTAFLDCQRATLAFKCDGLSDDQLRQRAVPPSSLSLLGLASRRPSRAGPGRVTRIPQRGQTATRPIAWLSG